MWVVSLISWLVWLVGEMGVGERKGVRKKGGWKGGWKGWVKGRKRVYVPHDNRNRSMKGVRSFEQRQIHPKTKPKKRDDKLTNSSNITNN